MRKQIKQKIVEEMQIKIVMYPVGCLILPRKDHQKGTFCIKHIELVLLLKQEPTILQKDPVLWKYVSPRLSKA